jgi:uncharacterized protein YcfJ
MKQTNQFLSGLVVLFILTTPVSDAFARALFTYPLEGQTPEQENADRAACHEWAVAQSGFDPTLVPPGRRGAERAGRGALGGLIVGGIVGAATGGLGLGLAIGAGSGGLIGGVIGSNEQARLDARYDAYLRAGETCMEARGYQVSR